MGWDVLTRDIVLNALLSVCCLSAVVVFEKEDNSQPPPPSPGQHANVRLSPLRA